MKVISFSLWGDTPMYTTGAIVNCKLAKQIYPDWVVWMYVDNSVPLHIIDALKNENAHIINMDEYNSNYNVAGKYGTNTWINGTWRYLPCTNDDVEVFISRDADSRLGTREANIVNEWIESDKDFHIIRDHHNHLNPISAGMFGVKRGPFYQLIKNQLHYFYSEHQSTDHQKQSGAVLKGIDEEFLTLFIYPHIKSNVMSHVSAGAYHTGDTLIGPPENDDFIGNVYYDAEGLNKGYIYQTGLTQI